MALCESRQARRRCSCVAPRTNRAGSLARQIDERLGLTPDEFRVEGNLVAIGPIYGDGGDALGELIAELEGLGLVYFDDFFELSGNWPEWLDLARVGGLARLAQVLASQASAARRRRRERSAIRSSPCQPQSKHQLVRNLGISTFQRRGLDAQRRRVTVRTAIALGEQVDRRTLSRGCREERRIRQ